MKKYTLSLLSALFALTSWAVPARKGAITHVQADGTEIVVELVGDEFYHHYVNLATGEIMEMTPNGDFTVISTAQSDQQRQQAKARSQAVNEERMRRLPSYSNAPNKAIGQFGNMAGQKRGLVILVNFADVQMQPTSTQQIFNNQFNQTGYNLNNHIGSVRDYFLSQSYGALSIDFDVVGPVTVSNTMAYYGSNVNGSDAHPAEMVIEALQLADAQHNVDFTKYDWNGDGNVDQVFIIYAGYAEAQGAPAETIWPHEWTLSSAKVYNDGSGAQIIDGKKVNTYACTAELCGKSGTVIDGIGTACHEFSHCLGYPDVYDTAGDSFGMDAYDLMDYGSYNGPNNHGEVPCGYTAYERWMAGWLTPVELNMPSTITGMPDLGDQPAAYIIYNANNHNEYFLLENRQNKGWYGYCRKLTTCHGLLITHVDYQASAWSTNKVNTDAAHQRMTYVPADGAQDHHLSADLFPTGANSFTATSHTQAWGSFFTASSQRRDVTDIAETNGLISFKFNGGDGSGTLTSPYSVSEIVNNQVGGSCWVYGKIVGFVKNGKSDTSDWNYAASDFTSSQNTNLALQDENGDIIAVKLAGDMRQALGLYSNPTFVNKNILVCGEIGTYFANPGLTSVTAYRWADITLDDDEGYSAAEAQYVTSVEYMRDANMTRWNAICLPFEIDDWEDCYRVLALHKTQQGGSDVVTFRYLESGEVMEANVPYLIKGRTESDNMILLGAYNTVVEKAEPACVTSNIFTFTGNYTPGLELGQNQYALASGVFKHSGANASARLKPFRAYIELPSGSQGKPALSISIEGEESGIVDIEGDNAEETTEGVFYNLQGQPVDNPAPGIYIFNGHKVILK